MMESVRVIDPQTKDSVPADGETVGEIVMRGNTVMKGYLKNDKATAEVFENFEISVDLIPERTFSEGFLEAFPSSSKEENRILLVQAEKARPTIYEGLTKLGWQVEKVVGYRNIDTKIEKTLLSVAADADAIVFTASSAINRYYEIIGAPKPPDAICIGPITAETARNLGWRVFEAREQSVKDLVEAVKQWAGS